MSNIRKQIGHLFEELKDFLIDNRYQYTKDNKGNIERIYIPQEKKNMIGKKHLTGFGQMVKPKPKDNQIILVNTVTKEEFTCEEMLNKSFKIK